MNESMVDGSVKFIDVATTTGINCSDDYIIEL